MSLFLRFGSYFFGKLVHRCCKWLCYFSWIDEKNSYRVLLSLLLADGRENGVRRHPADGGHGAIFRGTPGRHEAVVGRHRRSRMFRSLQRVSAQRLRQIVSNLVLWSVHQLRTTTKQSQKWGSSFPRSCSMLQCEGSPPEVTRPGTP